MKRLIALMLVCMLLPVSAFAGGLSGLMGEMQVSLPDPAAVLNVKGSLFKADYAFNSEYLCDAYLYEYANANVQTYLTAVENAGYQTRPVLIDGQHGYYLSINDQKAMLVPAFSGKLLLLVEKGMAFDGAMIAGTLPSLTEPPAAQPEEPEEDEYVNFTYNGRTYKCTSPMYTNGREPIHNAYKIWLTVHNCPIDSINFTIPDYSAAGDTFTAATTLSVPGLEFYVVEDGSSYGQYYVSDMGAAHSFGFANSTDYYLLKIQSLELDGGVYVIKGTIRARFLYDTISYEIDFKVRVP